MWQIDFGSVDYGFSGFVSARDFDGLRAVMGLLSACPA